MTPDAPAASGISAGGGIAGIASTGGNATNVQIEAEHVTALPAEAFVAPEVVAAPVGLVNLPVRPELFVGREQMLARLDTAASGAGVVVVQTVHGLGGIGKSTLVARWAALHAGGGYTPVWWITADSVAGLDAGLVALAEGLQPGLSAMLPAPVLRERAVRWLASHEGWLLVLDNVTDPAHLTDLLGRLPHGRIVVTSRRATGWPDLVTTLRLDVLELGQAVELLTLTAARGGVVVGEPAARAVCAELGCLPLAVEQAGAYLAQTGTDAGEYLQLLARYPADIYRDAEEGRAAERTIARVWQVTLDALADDPLPGRLLRLMAWYAPEAIPRLLVDGFDRLRKPAINRAIGRLAAYNMVTVDPATGGVTVHRLVQAVARTPDDEHVHRRAADITAAYGDAVSMLTTVLPDDWRDPASWPVWRAVLPHLDATTTHPHSPLPDTEPSMAEAHLCNEAGMFLLDQGSLTQAIAHLQQAFTDFRRVLGDDHPNTLTSVNNLASAYQTAGDLGRAIPLYEQALIDSRRVLGGDHPNTLTSVGNLAGAYLAAGDLGRAIPLCEQALTDRRRVLGDDHPNTLNSVNNLAYAYLTAGDPGRAIPLHEQAVAGCRRVLGDDHLNTLTSVNNLAYAYQTMGDLGRAIPLCEQALTDRRRVLGDDHPDTLNSVNNLAYAYLAAGIWAGPFPCANRPSPTGGGSWATTTP